MEQITNTFEIPACNLESLEQKIKKLNRKALKLNCQPITSETFDTFEKTPVSNNQDMNDYYITHNITTTYYKVKLSGVSPIIAGYELIASCEAMENGTLIKTIPGKIYPEEYRELLVCEHCNSDRKRKYTFIVRHIESDTYKMVGKSCLKDFLGHVDPQFYASYLEIINISDNSNEFDGIPLSAMKYDISRYLNIVAAVIREKGFISKSKAYEEEGILSTSDIAEKYITDTRGKYTIDITDNDKKIAEDALNWCKNLPSDSLNDYLYNIYLLSHERNIRTKDFGFVASIIPSYLKTIERQIEAEKKLTQTKEESISDYIGTPGEKIQIELTYMNSFSYEFQYSAYNSQTNFIHKFLDNNGNIFIWKTAKSIKEIVNGKNFYTKECIDVNIGHNLKLKGSIKEHNLFNKAGYAKRIYYPALYKGIL